MKCIFYEKITGIIACQIVAMMNSSKVENSTETYHTIKTLSQRLARPFDGMGIMVLIAANREDLLNILELHALFSILKIIIILPDREDESVKLGYNLRPRFLTYVNGDLSEVRAVLAKMLELDAATIETQGAA